MAIACRTCGNQNPENATFCQYCGAGLQQSAASTPSATPSYDQPTQVVGQMPPTSQPAQTGPSQPPPNLYGQPASGPPPLQQPYGGPPAAPAYGYSPTRTPAASGEKDPTTGLLIEMIPGFFGFMGIGWLWAGETAIGVALLLGFWVFLAIEIALMFVLIGFCLLPLNLIAPIASGFLLQKRLKERQALPATTAQPF